MEDVKQAEEDGDEDEEKVQSTKELLEELEYELDKKDATSEYKLKVCLHTHLICLCVIVLFRLYTHTQALTLVVSLCLSLLLSVLFYSLSLSLYIYTSLSLSFNINGICVMTQSDTVDTINACYQTQKTVGKVEDWLKKFDSVLSDGDK